MTNGWFDELYGASQHLLEVMLNALAPGYAWAKEWQILLAGLLVFFAAIIVARAILKMSATRPVQAMPDKKQTKLDLREAAKPVGANPVGANPASQELVGNLEQLRSLIRSALASFTL